MKAKLTATTIKNIQLTSKPFEIVDTEIKGFLLRVQPSGSMSFYYTYRTEGGNRKRIKLGLLGKDFTIGQARDMAMIHAGDVRKGVDVQKARIVKRRAAEDAQQRTLGVFIEKHYEPWVLANRKTGLVTLEKLKTNFPDFMKLALEDISVRRVELWRTQKLKKGIKTKALKPSSVNRAVTALRALISKAMEWGLLEHHPLEKLKPLKVDNSPKVRYLTDHEEQGLLDAMEQRDQQIKDQRASGNKHRELRGYPLLPDLSQQSYADRLTPLVTLSLKTGMRRGEAFDLQWSDVDFINDVITIQGGIAKSGKTRHIPLSPDALKVMKTWARQSRDLSGRVFPADDGGRLDNVRKSWASTLDLAGIQNFRWHDIRHHFASKLVMRGVPLNTVRELCGHSEMNTTLRYAHLAPDHKAEAVALID
ncbi:MAG: site-specific integrase [Halopseudomonas sp.]